MQKKSQGFFIRCGAVVIMVFNSCISLALELREQSQGHIQPMEGAQRYIPAIEIPVDFHIDYELAHRNRGVFLNTLDAQVKAMQQSYPDSPFNDKTWREFITWKAFNPTDELTGPGRKSDNSQNPTNNKDDHSTGIKISRELFRENMATKHLIIAALNSAELLRQNLLKGNINNELWRDLLSQDLARISMNNLWNLDAQSQQPEPLTLGSSSDNNMILGSVLNMPGLRVWLARNMSDKANDNSGDQIKLQALQVKSLQTCEVFKEQSNGLDIIMSLAFLTNMPHVQLYFLHKIEETSSRIWDLFLPTA